MDVLHKIQSWALENPHRKREVSPIEISVVSDTQEGESVPATLSGGWAPTPLEPPGPVSLYLWKTDPEFRGGTPAVRRTILRDMILKITERADAELRGIKWQRKKILEQVAAQQTAAVSPPMDTHELDAGLCALFGYQKVSVDEANKKVRFFPSDPRSWSAELPVWGATAGSRAVLHGPGEASVGDGLAAWVCDRERDGWKVDWPEADGTLDDIKGKMLQRGIGLGPRLEKAKKADWAAARGRAEAIAALGKF